MASALLISAALLALAGCGGEDDAPTAATSTVAATPSSASAGAAGSTADKELCESVRKAGEDMKSSLLTALGSDDDTSPAAFRTILTDLNTTMSSLAAAGGDSDVAAALTKFTEQASKAAAAADPASAAGSPAFEKTGADLTAACKPTGVDVNF